MFRRALLYSSLFAACSKTPATPTPTPAPTPAAIEVSIAPASAALPPDGSADFSATVVLAATDTVTWSVKEGTTCGAVDAAGHYTAPAAKATCHVVATSASDPKKSATASVSVSAPCDWTQWGGDSTHRGVSCSVGQSLTNVAFQTVYDPFTSQEQADSGGDLLAHYQSPLLAGDDVYMEVKSGTYTNCFQPPASPTCFDSEDWGEQYFHWEDGKAVSKWTFASDYKPTPTSVTLWEPVFHPAIFGNFLYVPGAGGTVHKVDRHSGVEAVQINPFATVDPNTYVAGPLTIDSSGSVYFNAVKFDATAPAGNDIAGAWSVQVASDDSVALVPYASLVPDAPTGATCVGTFIYNVDPTPWPPTPSAVPLIGACGSQRPGMNVAPAVSEDGTIFTVSRAHFNSAYSYAVALNADLTPKWHTSLRGYLNDGCGVTVPIDGYSYDCANGTTLGVDPATNARPAGTVDDTSSSTPVSLPDGGMMYGALTQYNDSRGHLFKLDAAGNITGTYDFGWDVTPAVYSHGATYSIVTKDNHYGYFFDVTQLDNTLTPEWSFRSTNPENCTRDEDGNVNCTTDPFSTEGRVGGHEWCVNAPVVDPAGTVFANSEDGRVYAIAQGGEEKAHLFLSQSLGAAYTPLSIDHAGRIYSLNLGTLTVVGN